MASGPKVTVNFSQKGLNKIVADTKQWGEHVDKVNLSQEKLRKKMNDPSQWVTGIKKVNEETDKTVSKFSQLQKGFGLIAAGFAAAKGFQVAINAAKEQEKAVNRLNFALATSGDFSKKASKDMQIFAAEMEKTTKIGDEVALNQLALAKSFGASNEQAKEIVKAAADMSAALGIDMESAVRNVAKTLGGYAGELGETIPALKEMTKEQLQAGEGVKLLANRFKGSAEGELQTFDGAVTQLSNTWGSWLEAAGDFIVKSDTIKTAIKGITKAINNSAEALKFYRKGFTNILDKVAGFITGTTEADEKLKKMGITIKEEVNKNLDDLSKKAKEAKTQVKEVADSVDQILKDDKLAGPQGMAGLRLFDEANLDKAKKVNADIIKEQEEAEKQRKKNLVGFAARVPGALQAGKHGFGRLVSSGLQTFGGPAGQIAGPLTSLLGQSEEQLRSQIRAFADGAVVFIENLITNIPVLIEELANAIPRVIERMAERIGPIIASLARAMPRVAIALALNMDLVAIGLAKSMPDVAKGLMDGLVGEAPRFIEELIKGIGEGLSKIVSRIVNSINPLSSDGFLGGAISQIPIVGDVFGAVGSSVGGAVSEVPVVGGIASSLGFRSLDSTRSLGEPQVINTQVNFRSQVLADIMIELDRTGVRTSAS